MKCTHKKRPFLLLILFCWAMVSLYCMENDFDREANLWMHVGRNLKPPYATAEEIFILMRCNSIVISDVLKLITAWVIEIEKAVKDIASTIEWRGSVEFCDSLHILIENNNFSEQLIILSLQHYFCDPVAFLFLVRPSMLIQNHEGRSLLHVACSNKYTEIQANFLVSIIITAAGGIKNEKTALSRLLEIKETMLSRLLLKGDGSGNTALHYASRLCWKSCMSMLISAASNIDDNKETLKALLFAKGSFGKIALDYCDELKKMYQEFEPKCLLF